MRISLTKQVGVLLVPIGVTLVSLGLFYERFSRVSAEGPFIAMAGQQRLLSKQLGVYAHMVHIGQEEDRAELRESIEFFEPFFTTKEVGKGAGTGMGLSFCFSIAREHGGRLWAEPCTAGARLVLELPIRTDAGESITKEAIRDAG